MAIPKRTATRLRDGIKRFQPVLETQRDRDISEADTVTVVKDILSEVFGYDKYTELTGEHAIRGTYCDLAVQLDGKLRLLIEVKAIGLALNDRHLKQAVDYAANQGCDWVALTNGVDWHLHHVLFQKPIEHEEVLHVNLLEVNTRSADELERLYMLTREAVTKDALTEFRDRQDATSRFVLAAILLKSEAAHALIRREVRRVSGMLIDTDTIVSVLREQVIKREAQEGEQAEAAGKRVSKASDKELRKPRTRKPKPKPEPSKPTAPTA